MNREIEQTSSPLSAARRRAVILILAAVPLLILGCGGETDATEGSSGDRQPAAAEVGADTDTGDAADAADAADVADAADAGAGAGAIQDAPAPGSARFEVDGQVYPGELRACDLADSAFMVSALTEVDGQPYEFGGNGQRPASNWSAQAGLTPMTDGPGYFSANGTVTIDGPTLLYVGDFNKIDGNDTEDVGEGRVIVTCG